jgi:MerR family transcriptional regulator, light-induced transcriptional regulator
MGGLTSNRSGSSTWEPLGADAWKAGGQLVLGADHANALVRTVETEIVPRLVALYQGMTSGVPPRARVQRGAVGEAEVVQFTDLVLRHHEPALAVLRQLAERGVTAHELCLDLLAPAARRLGEMWNADRCDFTDVTIALGRLQLMLRELAARMALIAPGGVPARRVLLLAVAGDQHTFGLAMVRDFFRAAGWRVATDAPSGTEALKALVKAELFDVVGFTVGSELHIEDLATAVHTLRRHSRNPDVRVLVGGPLLLERPDLAAQVGADATAIDARQAILEAERQVATRDEGR